MISDDDVRKIAKLAHLTVTDGEVKKFGTELNAIIGYVQQLEKLDVSGVEPMSHVHGSTNVFRDDVVQESLPVEALLSIAPDKSGRFIRVPIIIDQTIEN